MRSGFSGPLVRLLVAAFALSLVALFGAARSLWLTAAPAGCVTLKPGLLAFHYEFSGYNRGDEVLYRVCLVLSTGILLFGGIRAAAIGLFG